MNELASSPKEFEKNIAEYRVAIDCFDGIVHSVKTDGVLRRIAVAGKSAEPVMLLVGKTSLAISAQLRRYAPPNYMTGQLCSERGHE